MERHPKHRPIFRRLVFLFLLAGTLSLTPALGAAEKFQAFSKIKLPGKFVKDLHRFRNELWVATSGGVVRYNLEDGGQTTYKTGNGLAANFVNQVYATDEEVWFATPKGLSRLNRQTGKFATFTRAGKELADDDVRAVIVDGDNVWVGTRLGVNRYQKSLNKWSTVDALSGMFITEISDFLVEQDRLWVAGRGGISAYDKGQGIWETFDQGLIAPVVTSLSSYGGFVYCGTLGGGLARFSKETGLFESFGSEDGLVDDQVLGLAPDGQYLWLQTFSGISRFDVSKDIVSKNFTGKQGLTEISVNAGVVYGNKLFVGTDGGGLNILEKDHHEVALSPRSGYSKKGQISFYATNFSTKEGKDVENLKLSYRPQGLVGEWQTKGLQAASGWQGQDKLVATLNTKGLSAGGYSLKMESRIEDGPVNTMVGSFTVDNTRPALDLNLKKPKAGEKVVKLRGTFVEDNLKSIEIRFSGTNKVITPEINYSQFDFTFNYTLGWGDIIIKATDLGMNESTLKQPFLIDDKDPVVKPKKDYDFSELKGVKEIPITGVVIERNLESVIVNPGQIKADITRVGLDKWEFSAKAPVKYEGNLTFSVFAFDQSGREGKAEVTVKFYAEETEILVDDNKILNFTLKDEAVLSGSLIGPLLKEFYIFHPGKNQKYPIKVDVKENKSTGITTKNWEVKVPLQAGKNELQLVAVHKQTNEKVSDIYIIERGEGRPVARVDPEDRFFKSNEVTVTGRIEPGVEKVFVQNKPARVDRGKGTFAGKAKIKEGVNSVSIRSVDELGRVTRRKVDLVLDREAPKLRVRPLPGQTSVKELPVEGTVKDLGLESLIVTPGGRVLELDPEQNKFKAVVNLKPGLNRVEVKAVDQSGNRSSKEFYIEWSEKYPRLTYNATADQLALIQQLKEEIEQLKEQLAAKGPMGPVKFGTPKVALPKSNSLHFVPFKLKNSGSLADLSNRYFGSPTGARLIASFNRSSSAKTINRRGQILVPTPNLYRFVSRNRRHYGKMINIAASSFAREGAGKSLSRYRGHIIREMRHRRMLSRLKSRGSYQALYLRDGSVMLLTKSGLGTGRAALKRELRRSRRRSGMVASFSGTSLYFSVVRL